MSIHVPRPRGTCEMSDLLFKYTWILSDISKERGQVERKSGSKRKRKKERGARRKREVKRVGGRESDETTEKGKKRVGE